MIAGAVVIGLILGFLIKLIQVRLSIRSVQDEAEKIIAAARENARELEIQAKDKVLKINTESEAENSKRRTELNREDERLLRRRNELDTRTDKLELREQRLNKRQSQMDRKQNEILKSHDDAMEKLQSISQLTIDEARTILLDEVEKDSRNDMARIIRQIETEAKEEGEKKARKLIALAIQRVASEHVSEITTSVVALPNDEMKGRIIGRSGRNIRSFEQSAGVDIIVDDTPEAVTISGFDPIRREIARRALDKLILDGRIHPASIEKTIQKETRDVEKAILEAGEEAAFDAGIPNLHREVVRMMGRLKFRTSYGQNQLSHAVETAKIAAVIAAELGADVEIAKGGGFLHDIGKAMDHNLEGTHAAIGAEFLRRYRVNNDVINAVASHHHETEQVSVEAVIVEAADAISGARPGARRESLDQYVKRIRSLEEIANSFDGVSQTYALQAGREVRIIVKPEQVDDYQASKIARDVARQIEETMQYPGQIKVTVLRETRVSEVAK